MSTKINAYLTFNDNCREVMGFYKECLGGELYLQSVAESPVAAQMPEKTHQLILHSTLTNGDLIIMGSDMKKTALIEGNSISLCIQCSSDKEIESFFTNLSVGGKIDDPLQKMFWGAKYGSLTDKYGKKWIFNYDETQQ